MKHEVKIVFERRDPKVIQISAVDSITLRNEIKKRLNLQVPSTDLLLSPKLFSDQNQNTWYF